MLAVFFFWGQIFATWQNLFFFFFKGNEKNDCDFYGLFSPLCEVKVVKLATSRWEIWKKPLHYRTNPIEKSSNFSKDKLVTIWQLEDLKKHNCLAILKEKQLTNWLYNIYRFSFVCMLIFTLFFNFFFFFFLVFWVGYFWLNILKGDQDHKNWEKRNIGGSMSSNLVSIFSWSEKLQRSYIIIPWQLWQMSV